MKRMSVLPPLVLTGLIGGLLAGLFAGLPAGSAAAAAARPDSAADPFAPSSAPIPPGMTAPIPPGLSAPIPPGLTAPIPPGLTVPISPATAAPIPPGTAPDPLGTSPDPLGADPSLPASPDPQQMTWTGEGTAVVDAGGPITESLLFTFQHEGVPGDISVRAVQPGGGAGEQLVQAAGGTGYTTTTVVNRQHGAAFSGFSVVAPGAWKITLQPLDQARQWSTDAPLTGRNGDVVRLGAGLTTIGTLVYAAQGTGAFRVYAYTKTGTQTLVVEQKAPVKGAKPVPNGTVLLLIEATGPWTLIRG